MKTATPKNALRLRAAPAMIATALLAGALLPVGGCAPRTYTHGNQLDPDSLARVVPGQTRVNEVLALFGKPSTTGAFNSGKIYYVSQYMETKPGGRKQTINRKLVTFSYDANGVITAVDITDEEGDRRIAHVKDVTPVPGNTFGILDQILSNINRRRDGAPPPRPRTGR